MTAKPVVSFAEFIGVEKHPHSGVIRAALRYVTGHPTLGDEAIVYTSRLYRLGYDAFGEVDEVETANTIYRRAK